MIISLHNLGDFVWNEFRNKFKTGGRRNNSGQCSSAVASDSRLREPMFES